MISAPSAISHLLPLPPDPILNEELIFHALSAGTVPSTAKLSFPLGNSTTREVTPAAVTSPISLPVRKHMFATGPTLSPPFAARTLQRRIAAEAYLCRKCDAEAYACRECERPRTVRRLTTCNTYSPRSHSPTRPHVATSSFVRPARHQFLVRFS